MYVNWKSLSVHSCYSTIYFSAGLVKSLWNSERSFQFLETERMSKTAETTREGKWLRGKDILQEATANI